MNTVRGMSDDDIQYIGTKNAPRAIHADHPFPIAQKTVTGVTLFIEASNDQPAYGMVFRRCHFSVVNIGRRPGGPPLKKRFEPTNCGRAMFRCPVISRQHAKIAFSDSGHAYLIDLNSHHGTHVLKPGEVVSKMLTPEVPTILAHGDVVTFGKSVGRDSHIVHPVVVRIGLLYDVQSEAPSSPSVVTLPSLPAPPSPNAEDLESPERAKRPSKTPSGRYGVYVPSSSGSGSDDSSPNSSHDSDIEELDGPPCSKYTVTENLQLERAFNALKQFVSPTRIPSIINIDSRSQSPSQRSSSPLYDPYSPPFSPIDPCSSFVPYDDFGHPCSLNESDSPPYSHIGFDAYSNDIFEERSRSRSAVSMELCSPSPEHSPEPSVPKVIGAWETSRSASPAAAAQPESSTTVDPVIENALAQEFDTTEATIVAEEVPQSNDPMSPTSVEAVSSESRHPSQSPAADRDIQPESVNEPEIPGTKVPKDLTSEPVQPDDKDSDEKPKSNIATLQSSLDSMRGAVSKLQLHRRKYKARFNANVHAIAEKLTDLDERVTDATALWTSLADKLENAVDIDIPDLHSAVDSMQDQISSMTPAQDSSATKVEVLSDREDVKASIGTLNTLVAEMTSLRKTTEKEMAAELEAVKSARNSAVAMITQTTLNASLKRKRSDDDEGVSVSTSNGIGFGIGRNAAVRCGGERTLNLFLPTPSLDGLEVPSPPKRARRIVATVVQTATAVTLGAVATWSALAFS